MEENKEEMKEKKEVVKAKRFRCVVNFPKDTNDLTYLDVAHVQRHLSKLDGDYGCFFWAILHDKDMDEDGVMKTPHYHIVLEFGSRRHLNKVIDILSDYLGVPRNCVSVRKSENKIHDLRYLTHLDDLDKYGYDLRDVITNRYPDLNVAINTSMVLDIFELVRVVKSCKGDYLLIASAIGLENARKYNNIIKELINRRIA